MTRPLRLQFENAIYHVMNRGAGRRNIYINDEQRYKFLEIIEYATQLFGIEVFAWCLMDNHYHLLIKTPRANLSRAMRHINGVYAQFYNRMQGTDGPLFRGRYRAIVVEGDDYILQVSRYIHLNPVAAKMVVRPSDYRWSSYLNYINPTIIHPWITIEEILTIIGNGSDNTEIYRNFVEEKTENEVDNFLNKEETPVILGQKECRIKHLGNITKEIRKSSLPDYNRTRVLPSNQEVISACCVFFNINKKNLLHAQRGKSNIFRKVAIYGCRVWASGTLMSVAAYFNCSGLSSISDAVRDVERKMKMNAEFKETVEKIKRLNFQGI